MRIAIALCTSTKYRDPIVAGVFIALPFLHRKKLTSGLRIAGSVMARSVRRLCALSAVSIQSLVPRPPFRSRGNSLRQCVPAGLGNRNLYEPPVSLNVQKLLKSKVFGSSVVVAGLACLVGRAVLAAYLVGVRPKTPQSELGLTYPFNQHGGIVYLTHFESIFLMALFVSAAILIAVGGYIYNNLRADQAKFR